MAAKQVIYAYDYACFSQFTHRSYKNPGEFLYAGIMIDMKYSHNQHISML